MTSRTLGEAYIEKARARLLVLDVLKDAGASMADPETEQVAGSGRRRRASRRSAR